MKDRNSGVRLGVVVPMFNEAAGAERCVRRLLDALPGLPIDARLIVVDDGSSDGTGALLDALRDELGGFDVVHQKNAGYGGALASGAREAARGGLDYVLFMDSDLTNPPEHIVRFVAPMLQGFDVIKGARFSHGGDMDAVPLQRRAMSVGANVVARTLFRVGIADCTNGFRALRTELFLKMPLKERGFAIIVEELYWAKRMGATIACVPTSLTARSTEQRSSTFSYRPRIFYDYLKYALAAALVR